MEAVKIFGVSPRRICDYGSQNRVEVWYLEVLVFWQESKYIFKFSHRDSLLLTKENVLLHYQHFIIFTNIEISMDQPPGKPWASLKINCHNPLRVFVWIHNGFESDRGPESPSLSGTKLKPFRSSEWPIAFLRPFLHRQGFVGRNICWLSADSEFIIFYIILMPPYFTCLGWKGFRSETLFWVWL